MSFDKSKIKSSLKVYAITDRSWLGGRELKDEVEEVLLAGATFLQLREKSFTHKEIVEEGRVIKKITDKYGVPFVINDDIYAAKEIDADGVHIGQSDMEYSKARQILGPDKIIGMTARTVEEAMEAERVGADYIGVGAVFHTSTKKDAKDMEKETLLAISKSVDIPIVAIGGITYENMDYLKGTGVDGIAVVSEIFAAENCGRATERLVRKAMEIFE